MTAPFANCRVVLVRPQIAANVGAVARAMRNFGLSDLVLVEPAADPADREARRLATHGEGILDRARRVTEFGEAVADCVLVAATSARTGGLFRAQTVGWPEQIMPAVIDAAGQGPAALVFGTESSGLTNEEVSRCHFLIHIPADADYPALNLAQSVVICLYELRLAWMRDVQPSRERERPEVEASQLPVAHAPRSPVADCATQEQMYAHLRDALEAIHFLYGEKSDALMHAVRHLIGRAKPTRMEVKLLHGLARQLLWVAGEMRSRVK
jgi:tRNA/rRNA methyltransferase